MKKYQSKTANKGTTIILDSVEDAILIGRNEIQDRVDEYGAHKADKKMKVVYKARGGKESEQGSTTYGEMLASWKRHQSSYAQCVEAIRKGDPSLQGKIGELMDELICMTREIAPMLSASKGGYELADDGEDASPELAASGEPNCCYRRKQDGNEPASGEGDGAYRIIINTDVAWNWEPDTNAALMGALIVILQQAKPVEVYIQQGWIGEYEGDGVTLFKLDFAAGFDATQLTFWLNHPCKDSTFSYCINRGLDRSNFMVSGTAEIPADLYLCGHPMASMGIWEQDFNKLTPFEQADKMAQWIAATAMKIEGLSAE